MGGRYIFPFVSGKNVGDGSGIFRDLTGATLNLRSITGTSNNKISTQVSGDTVQIDINEPNLTLWPLVVQGNTLITGGATYLSGLTFDVSYLEYIIGTQNYSAAPSQVTLASGDTSFDRIDVIYADISGNTGSVQGIPSATPSKPTLDSSTQIEVTFVTVSSGSEEPDVQITKVYDENLGSGGGEWDFSTNAAVRIDGDSTNDAFSGTKSIELTNAISGDSFSMSIGTPYDISSDNVLSFYVKNISDWSSVNEFINISLRDSGDTINGSAVRFDDGKFGLDATNTSGWQVISIPLGSFNLSSNLVSKVKFELDKDSGASSDLDLYIDLIRFQSGAPTASPQNIWLSFVADDNNVATAGSNTDQFRLSGGTNITTAINGKTGTFNLDDDVSLNTLSANTLYSGSTNVEDVIRSIASETELIDLTRVQDGINTFTGGTDNNPTVNVTGLSIDNITVSGESGFQGLSATTLYSGSTDVEDVIRSIASETELLDLTRVQDGINTFTGGTGNLPTVNVTGLSIDNITVSGESSFQGLSATTLYSGSSDLSSLFNPIGLNIYESDGALSGVRTVSGSGFDLGFGTTGSLLNTFSARSSNGSSLNSLNAIIDGSSSSFAFGGVSGLRSWDSSGQTGNLTAIEVSDFFGDTGKIKLQDDIGNFGAYYDSDYSANGLADPRWIPDVGAVELMISTGVTVDETRVQPGTNINTGGTANEPVINLDDNIDVVSVSADTIYSGSTDLSDIFLYNSNSISPTQVAYADSNGHLKGEGGFTYNETTNELSVERIIVGNTSTTAETTATVYGNILLIGDAISGFTSELYIEDNRIELNYNPTASTESTSLGAGWNIQDGSGIAGTDVFFDIRGNDVGNANRSFATNVEDIRIRESGTTSSPNGVRVLAEYDELDGGSF